MNERLSIFKNFLHKSGIIVLFLFSHLAVFSQAPTHYPTGNDPVKFTPFNIFIYIVVPVLFVIIYLWWRQMKRRERRKKMEEKNRD